MKTPVMGGAAGKIPSSNQEWQAWGDKDPLFGVIPQTGRERGGSDPWTDNDFYETGRSDWEEFRERWTRYGLELDTCVEIGCGAGRLTRHIANDFRLVHGMDVADGMLNYARKHMPSNVELHLSDGVSLPIPDQSATAVFSVIVFLHFDSVGPAAAYFREMARILKPGGTILIQMPIHTWPSNLRPMVREWYQAAHNGYMALRRLKARYHRFLLSRHKWSPFMQSITYDAEWVQNTLGTLGFRDIETCAFPLRRGTTVYTWVLARKAYHA